MKIKQMPKTNERNKFCKTCNIRNESDVDQNFIIPPDKSPNLTEIKIFEELSIDFFEGKCVDIAKNLLGKLILNKTKDGIAGGIIVETEAYLGKNDPACHLSNGYTKRNRPFYKGKGTIYIFKIHKYNNLNVISEYHSYSECILIRAIEPTHGIEMMKRRRGTDNLLKLTTGPGKLTESLGILKENSNNKKLNNSTISFYNTNFINFDIIITNRIGISKAKEWPLRYCVAKNPFVSKKIGSDKVDDWSFHFNENDYYEKFKINRIYPLNKW